MGKFGKKLLNWKVIEKVKSNNHFHYYVGYYNLHWHTLGIPFFLISCSFYTVKNAGVEKKEWSHKYISA